MSVPGIGPMISTAMVAAIGTGEAFERGRDFGAWLGLVPRQYSTGGRSILGRISKRGSKYLRTLFIQAANVILMRPHNWEKFSFGAWLQGGAAADAPQQAGDRARQQARPHRLERAEACTAFDTHRMRSRQSDGRPSHEFAIENGMERIDRPHPESDDPNGSLVTCPLMRPKARAYSHQGHGPRADQTGRIHISDFRFPRKLTCETQPVHTFGSESGHRGDSPARPASCHSKNKTRSTSSPRSDWSEAVREDQPEVGQHVFYSSEWRLDKEIAHRHRLVRFPTLLVSVLTLIIFLSIFRSFGGPYGSRTRLSRLKISRPNR